MNNETRIKDNNIDTRKDQTISMLGKHHGDGEEFAKLMEETFAGRFNEDFWALWEQHIDGKLSDGSIVVDFGTGPATFVKTLANKYRNIKVLGVECAPYMLNAIDDLPENTEIIEADLQNPMLALPENSVDAAISSAVVHEMIQPIRMFKEIQRVLKPGGRFYIFDWVRSSLEAYLSGSETNPFESSVSQEVLEDLFTHFIEHNRFSLEDLIFMLNKIKFTIIDSGLRADQQHAWVLAEKTE